MHDRRIFARGGALLLGAIVSSLLVAPGLSACSSHSDEPSLPIVGDPAITRTATALGETAARYGITWWEASLQDFSHVAVDGIAPPEGARRTAIVFYGHSADGRSLLGGRLVVSASQLESLGSTPTASQISSVFAGTQVGGAPGSAGAAPLPDDTKIGLLKSVVQSFAASAPGSPGAQTQSFGSGLHPLDMGSTPPIQCDPSQVYNMATMLAALMSEQSACNNCSDLTGILLGAQQAMTLGLTATAPAQPTKNGGLLVGMNGIYDLGAVKADSSYWSNLNKLKVKAVRIEATASNKADLPTLISDIHTKVNGHPRVILLLGSQLLGGAPYQLTPFSGDCSCTAKDPSNQVNTNKCVPDGVSQGDATFIKQWSSYLTAYENAASSVLGALSGASAPDEYELLNEPDNNGNDPLKEVCYVSLLTKVLSTPLGAKMRGRLTSGIASAQYYCDLAGFWGGTSCDVHPSSRASLQDPWNNHTPFNKETQALLFDKTNGFRYIDLHPYNEWPSASGMSAPTQFAADFSGGPLIADIRKLNGIFTQEHKAAPDLIFTEWGNQVFKQPTSPNGGADSASACSTAQRGTFQFVDCEQAALIRAMWTFLDGTSNEANQVKEAYFFKYNDSGNAGMPMGLTYNTQGGKAAPFAASFPAFEDPDTACSACATAVLGALQGMTLPQGCSITGVAPDAGAAAGDAGSGGSGDASVEGGAQGGYAFVERGGSDQHHPVAIADSSRKGFWFVWHTATGAAPRADLSLEADGRPILQVAAVGDHPFLRAGLDLVPLEPNAAYRVVLQRDGDAIGVTVVDASDVAVLHTQRVVSEATADLVLPGPFWRSSIDSDLF